MRGSYLATVPRSSLARVRRVLVSHIMEEEIQEDEKDDKREETTLIRKESRRESEQPHHECMGWSEMCAARQT